MKALIAENARNEPDAQGLIRIKLPWEKVQLTGARRADDARQRPWAAHVARDADVEERDVEACGGRREAQVASARPAQPGARACSVHRGDGDCRHLVKKNRGAEMVRA